MNPAQNLQSHFSATDFNIKFPFNCGFLYKSPTRDFPIQIVCLIICTPICATCTVHLILLTQPQIWRRTVNVSPFSVQFPFPRGSRYTPFRPVLKYPHSMIFPCFEIQVLPQRKRQAVYNSLVPIFTFSGNRPGKKIF